MAGVRYVGAGVLLDGRDGQALHEGGLPGPRAAVLPYAVITPRQWETDPAACHRGHRRGRWGYRCSSSPAAGGSSIGISKVHDASSSTRRSRRPGGTTRRSWSRPRRSTVARSSAGSSRSRRRAAPGQRGRGDPGRRQPRVLRLRGEVPPRGAHRARRPGRPARPPGQAGAGARGGGLRGTLVRGLARVDFFVLPDERVVINEINTMPGFTPSSMFPRMWAASGLDYPALVDRLISSRLPWHRAALNAGVGLGHGLLDRLREVDHRRGRWPGSRGRATSTFTERPMVVIVIASGTPRQLVVGDEPAHVVGLLAG